LGNLPERPFSDHKSSSIRPEPDTGLSRSIVNSVFIIIFLFLYVAVLGYGVIPLGCSAGIDIPPNSQTVPFHVALRPETSSPEFAEPELIFCVQQRPRTLRI
jgi:hypothetical protein